MGLISDSVRALVPERRQAIGAAVPTWEAGTPQLPSRIGGPGYDQDARQGYMLDELVYGCVEVRATSAAEPRLCAYRADEKVEKHPALKLLERPNPFLDGFTFWATIMMFLDVAGNAYVEKVRSRSGKVVELWLLRPDRVRVIPDSDKFISGYSYTIGDHTFPPIPPEDIIHFKTRHPLDDYYGLSPIHVLANRIDLDVWSRQFMQSFFRNAGVPAGLLNIKRSVTDQEREMIKNRWRMQYGGPEGWGNVLVMDEMEAEYTAMGQPLKDLINTSLDQSIESRICTVYQVPLSLLPTIIGSGSSSYANRVSDRQLFWDSVLAPQYRYLAVTLSNGLQVDFDDLERFEFDLSGVRALQEDEDKKHARWREDWKAGLVGRKEARKELGLPAEPDEPDTYLIPIRSIETPSDEIVTQAESGREVGLPQEQETIDGGGVINAPALPDGSAGGTKTPR